MDPYKLRHVLRAVSLGGEWDLQLGAIAGRISELGLWRLPNWSLSGRSVGHTLEKSGGFLTRARLFRKICGVNDSPDSCRTDHPGAACRQ